MTAAARRRRPPRPRRRRSRARQCGCDAPLPAAARSAAGAPNPGRRAPSPCKACRCVCVCACTARPFPPTACAEGKPRSPPPAVAPRATQPAPGRRERRAPLSGGLAARGIAKLVGPLPDPRRFVSRVTPSYDARRVAAPLRLRRSRQGGGAGLTRRSRPTAECAGRPPACPGPPAVPQNGAKGGRRPLQSSHERPPARSLRAGRRGPGAALQRPRARLRSPPPPPQPPAWEVRHAVGVTLGVGRGLGGAGRRGCKGWGLSPPSGPAGSGWLAARGAVRGRGRGARAQEPRPGRSR
jgi:hypothetical protein